MCVDGNDPALAEPQGELRDKKRVTRGEPVDRGGELSLRLGGNACLDDRRTVGGAKRAEPDTDRGGIPDQSIEGNGIHARWCVVAA